MRLPHIAIQNHQFTIIIVIMLTLLGVTSFLTMPRSEDPAVSPAGSSVIVIYPGATPADIEELIVEPLEQVLNELDDIKRINSASEDGLGTVAVEFTSGSDPDEKYSDVVQKVNSIRDQLPGEVLSIELFKWTITDVNILQIALLSDDESYSRLDDAAQELKTRLEKAPGVRRVQTWAIPQQEIRVAVNLQKMAAWRISLNQVMGAIAGSNQNIPGGYLDIGKKRFNIRTSGSLESLDEIKKTVVHAANGRVVYLQGIADVFFAYEDPHYIARVNGERAVFITVQQKEGTNIFRVREALEQVMEEFHRELPPSIAMRTVFDQSKSVAGRLNGFFMNLLQGLVLVGAVVLITVGVRASTIVISVIPLSVLIGIGLIDLSGYGLQQMTIAGLVIALGMLVDNAIVVTVNISRFLRLGYDRLEAAAAATSQVGWAVVSSTLTTVFAFVPMMLMKDDTGDFIRSMPLIVIYTLMASLMVALTFTPYVSSRFLKVEKESRLPFRRAIDRLVDTVYRRMLLRALAHPKRVALLAVLTLMLSLGLFPLIGVSFFPKAEKPQFIININTPSGTNLDETNRIVLQVEDILEKFPTIDLYVSNIGHGNPRIYYNVFPKRERSTHAQIFVQLKAWELRSFYTLLSDLRGQFSRIPGATIEVKEFEQGPPVDAPVAIRITGDNLQTLQELSRHVEEVIKLTPGALNVVNPLATANTHLQMHVNRDKAGMLGVPLVEIDRVVRAAVAGATVSHYRDTEGKDYKIVVRLPFDSRPTLESLDKIYITSLSGASVPMKSLASVEFKASSMVIDHFALARTNTVTADVAAGYSVDETTRQIMARLQQVPFPQGYTYGIGGEWESRGESFSGMMQSMIIALIAIFAILVMQFKSYSQPLIVFSAIPLSLIGALWALFLSGSSFSFTAFVGLTSLVGIVVNNSILLVDYANQLRREGIGTDQALLDACATRFIPIFLTTTTTIGGLLPLALLGGSLWAPMSWTIIGGLTVSTILTLIVTPALYKLYTKGEGV